jgi:formate-dependent nitrite reductase membrane component NrfD
MKQVLNRYSIKTLLATFLLAFYQTISFAQDVVDVEVHPENAKSWLENNWLWVAIGVVLLAIIIGAMTGGSSRRKKTTIVRENGTDGTIRTTTTEIIE